VTYLISYQLYYHATAGFVWNQWQPWSGIRKPQDRTSLPLTDPESLLEIIDQLTLAPKPSFSSDTWISHNYILD